MKKILYIIGVFLLFAACSKEEITPQEQGTIQKSFSLSIEEPEDAPKSRAKVEMNRYLLEMYEGNLEGTLVRMENTTGKFKVTLKKGVDYICLFWADDGASYNAANLKAVKQTHETARGTAAYCTSVTVNNKAFSGAITLQRAVAELSFIDKNGLTEESNTLKVTYPYASAALNVGEGTVTRTAGETIRTITGIAPPDLATDAFTTDFILAPTGAGQLAGLKFQLNTEEEKTIASLAVQANFRTKITGEYQVPPTPSMSFIINTTKNTANTSDNTFTLPLKGQLWGYDLTVDWGDSSIETFASGTTLAQANMTHTYTAGAGEYTITITSSQLDPAQVQMPKLAFGQNYSSTNSNSKKLISLNSPLLNMGTDFSSCFRGCTNLTTIPATLFAKNPLVTTFNGCFYGCTGLKGEIPAGLFEKNIDATNFNSCFSGCTNLTGEIPALLFTANTEATIFNNCFRSCTGLTSIPAGLFAENPLVTNFSNCFSGCTGLTEIPAGLFAENPLVTNFSNCFYGCTGLTAVPELLFEKNTLATDFTNCFYGCTKLKLNANIFCDEMTEKDTRFKDRTIKFNFCFINCGSALTDGQGGTAPALWEYTMTSSTKTGCFTGVTKVTNVGDIPTGWK